MRQFIPEIWSRPLLNKFYDNCVLATLFPSPGPPTVMQRVRWRLRDITTRISTAAKILIGRIDPNSFDEDY